MTDPSRIQTAAELAVQLEELRLCAGLSFKRLAARAGIRDATAYNSARGRSFPRQDTLIAYVKACGEKNDEPWKAAWIRIEKSRAEQREKPLVGEPKTSPEKSGQYSTAHASCDGDAPQSESQTLPAALAMAPKVELSSFVERPATGELLVTALLNAAIGETVVVTGAGGNGKTILTAWACEQVRGHYPDGVVWVKLGRHPDKSVVINILSDLTALLTGVRPDRYHTVAIAAAAFDAALGHRRVLLVIDDAWRKEDVEPFLNVRHCVVVVITRRPSICPGRKIAVGSMTAEEGTSLLLRGQSSHSLHKLRPLLDRCGLWPLALSLLGGTLRSLLRRMSIEEVTVELAKQLDQRGLGVLDEHADSDERRIATTLAVSLEELATTSPHHGESLDRYVQLAAFAGKMSIPYRLLERLWALDVAVTQR